MKGGGGFIGNRIRTKNHNRSNHLREKCESDHVDFDSEPQLFSDMWPLTLSDGDADHTLEAGSDSVEGRRIVNTCFAWHVKVYLHLINVNYGLDLQASSKSCVKYAVM